LPKSCDEIVNDIPTVMKDEFRCSHVAAVVVTYNPDHSTLLSGLRRIAGQVALVVIVDNASRNFDIENLEKQLADSGALIKFVTLASNAGLGAGFNAGVREVRSSGFSFVTLFDQDSVPEKDMIIKFASAYETLMQQGSSIAALGPRFKDPIGGKLSHFVSDGAFGKRIVSCSGSDDIVEAEQLR